MTRQIRNGQELGENLRERERGGRENLREREGERILERERERNLKRRRKCEELLGRKGKGNGQACNCFPAKDSLSLSVLSFSLGSRGERPLVTSLLLVTFS